jgi:hypothetical protein
VLKTLQELWVECGEDKAQKFRFVDWNHKTKFFQIVGLDQNGLHFVGVLDNGEPLSIPLQSDFWIEYYPGDEFCARAV